MNNRKKVILHSRDNWRNDHRLTLTQEQIRLLEWLLNEDLISIDNWDMQVLEEMDGWVEV
jgi:hypothetical protein